MMIEMAVGWKEQCWMTYISDTQTDSSQLLPAVQDATYPFLSLARLEGFGDFLFRFPSFGRLLWSVGNCLCGWMRNRPWWNEP